MRERTGTLIRRIMADNPSNGWWPTEGQHHIRYSTHWFSNVLIFATFFETKISRRQWIVQRDEAYVDQRCHKGATYRTGAL